MATPRSRREEQPDWQLLIIEPHETHTLRQRILRRHQPVAEMAWEGDDDPLALHVAARRGEETLAVASVLPQGPENDDSGWWRVRGMATVEDQRSRGMGGQLLGALLGHAAAHGGGRVWCTVRTGAVDFYARHGFQVASDPFELPGIGPHVRMEVEVSPG